MVGKTKTADHHIIIIIVVVIIIVIVVVINYLLPTIGDELIFNIVLHKSRVG